MAFVTYVLVSGIVLGVQNRYASWYILKEGELGDNCIQNFHLGRYIVRYMVGILVLRWRVSWAFKCDFRMYIWRYTSPNDNFEYGYPHSNALLQSRFELERCKPQAIQLYVT